MDSHNAIYPRDIPAPSVPTRTIARSVTVVDFGSEEDPLQESVLLIRRQPIVVYDFYRGRPQQGT